MMMKTVVMMIRGQLDNYDDDDEVADDVDDDADDDVDGDDDVDDDDDDDDDDDGGNVDVGAGADDYENYHYQAPGSGHEENNAGDIRLQVASFST